MAIEVAAGFLWNRLPPLSNSNPTRRSINSLCLLRSQFSIVTNNHKSKNKNRLGPLLSSLTNQEQQQAVSPFTEPENLLLECLVGIQGRGRYASPQQLKAVELAVQNLEALEGVKDPTLNPSLPGTHKYMHMDTAITSSSLIEGCWQLMFTTRPGTASPIQRTFVGFDFFSIFQEVQLRTDDQRVCNIVRFSDAIGELKVEAVASIRDGKRILFRFDKAAFSFKFFPFKVPYPVPFRLLGDEAKGWLDTTYLSHTGNIRISRGNKGTTFVLQKRSEPRQKLLSAIATGNGVSEVIEEIISLNQSETNIEPKLLAGDWQLLWSSQTEAEGWIDVAANGLQGLQIVKESGQLENIIDFLPGLKFYVNGKFVKSDNNAYEVIMDNAILLVGIFPVPLEIISKFNMELLYIDNKIRITRGYRQILFVHLCVSRPNGK